MNRIAVVAAMMMLLVSDPVLAQSGIGTTLTPGLPAHVATPAVLDDRVSQQYEVATKLILDWHDQEAQGRIIQLSFSKDLNPPELGMALISQTITCQGLAAFKKQKPDQPFQGPVLARLIPDLVEFDSTNAKIAFAGLMSSADTMRSWEDPCIEG